MTFFVTLISNLYINTMVKQYLINLRFYFIKVIDYDYHKQDYEYLKYL